MWLSFIISFIIVLIHTETISAEEKPYSLTFNASFSVRSSQANSNPYDFEVATGLRGKYKNLESMINYAYERQNSKKYMNQFYNVIFQGKRYSINTKLSDHRERNFYNFQNSALLKPLSWLGVGITRQFVKKYIHAPAWLGQISIDKQNKIYSTLWFKTHADYAINPDRRYLYARLDIQGIKIGIISFMPYYIYEEIQQNHQITSNFQGKLAIEITLK